MKLVRSYIGDQRPALATTQVPGGEHGAHAGYDHGRHGFKDEDWDVGKYTLETIIGILSGAVTAVTGTLPSALR
jgi:hypothetical protein